MAKKRSKVKPIIRYKTHERFAHTATNKGKLEGKYG